MSVLEFPLVCITGGNFLNRNTGHHNSLTKVLLNTRFSHSELHINGILYGKTLMLNPPEKHQLNKDAKFTI